MALLGSAQGPVHVAEASAHGDACDPFAGLAMLPSCVVCAWTQGLAGACESLRASAPGPRLLVRVHI
jgi:hypothetical protein